MPYQQVDELPTEIKDRLLEGSAQIFVAAFNSAESDGMNESAAKQVAWNTVKQDYVQGDDGCWRRVPQQTNITNKAVQSGGN